MTSTKKKLIFSLLALAALTGIAMGSPSTEATAFAEGIASASYWISEHLVDVNITYNSDDNWVVVNGVIESVNDEYIDNVISDGAELATRVTQRYPSIEACSFTIFKPDGDTFVEVIVYN